MNNDTIRIKLSKKGTHKDKYVAIVDAVDADLDNFNWTAFIQGNTQYAYRKLRKDDGKQAMIRLHRVILERKLGYPIPDGMEVDHVDGNGLNNTRDNLRIVNHSQNSQNKSKKSNNKSGYKGVSWHKAANKWRADIAMDKKSKFLGLFETPESAYKAYCEAAKEYHGEFARLE